MLTSIRGLSAATLSVGLLLSAAPAFALEASSETSTPSPEGNVSGEAVIDGAISEELIAVSVALDNHAANGTGLVLTTQVERSSEPVDATAASNMGGESGITFSGNIAFTSEYRFRGVDLSGGEFAVQGGFDLSHSSGLYVGTWASNLDEQTVGFGSTEVDVYGGWSGDVAGGLSADVGVIAYLYPDAGAGNFNYVEFYGSLSVAIGPASLTGGVAYAPDQDSLGSTDNLYLYTDLGIGIPDTPITIKGHLGYTDGFLTFTNDSKAIDWSIGADVAVGPVTFTAAYVGVEGDVLVDPAGTFTDDAFVVTIAASF